MWRTEQIRKGEGFMENTPNPLIQIILSQVVH